MRQPAALWGLHFGPARLGRRRNVAIVHHEDVRASNRPSRNYWQAFLARPVPGRRRPSAHG